jgi:hypothetical protein
MVEFTHDDLTDLWVGAFRYYLGRATIAVHSFCESLVNHWPDVPERAQCVILRELKAAIDSGSSMGWDIDKHKWQWVFGELNEQGEGE